MSSLEGRFSASQLDMLNSLKADGKFFSALKKN
jgi:hypothetical protein